MSIQWQYAKNFSELPSGEAEKVEALVEIAEQIDKLNATLSATLNELLISLSNKP